MITKLKQKFIRKKIFISSAVIIALAAAIFAYSNKPWAKGAAVDDLNSQKQAVQQKLNDINAKIKAEQDQIAAAQKQANTLQNQLKILDLQIDNTQNQIDATGDQIDAANLEIADVTNQIEVTENNIDKEKNILRDLIDQINDLDQRSPLEIALENNNFTDFLNDLQFTQSIQEQSQEALTKIKALKSDLEQRNSELKVQKNQLVTLNDQLTAQQNSLTSQRGDKQSLLNQTKGKEANYQKLLASAQADQEELNDEINDLDNKIAAALGNNKIVPHKGLLAWPMNGTLTQGYGNTGFTSLGYSFHNGIDIAAPAGTKITAAADGTVVATGNATPSGIDGAYGNWVAIKHDTGAFASHPIITLYGHMSSYVLKKGQTVKEGDLVGFEGNTGNTSRILYGPHRGFHLHFTVFDAKGFTVVPGAHQSKYGAYQVPGGAPYNPLDFLG